VLTTTWTAGAAPTIHPPALEEDEEGELRRITLLSSPLEACYPRLGMKEAVDRFIETVVVGLFLAPFLWLALVLVFGLVAWLLMVLGLYDAGAGPD
jgi:hypothetical protein